MNANDANKINNMENKKNKLVVLAHFMDQASIRRVVPWLGWLPMNIIEFILWHLPARFSFVVAAHFDIIGQAEGYIVGIALTPRQMNSSKKEVVRKKILAATLYAQNKLGCQFLMLGGLTAPATSAGLFLTGNSQVKLNVTTGNAYTAAITCHSVYEAVKKTKLNLADLTVAVIGASGTIGEAVARVLENQAKDLILVGRDLGRLGNMEAKLIKNNHRISIEVDDISEADVIVTATSHPDALINPKVLKHKAIVIDVAEPSDMPKDFELQRPDVTNIDGGRVKWPDVNPGKVLGLPENVGFACITEGLMMALENDRQHHVGSIDLDYLRKTEEWGKKYGWGVANFTSFNKPVPLSKFEF
jgi:fatty aldehyde-generating acyl-ACP reductase